MERNFYCGWVDRETDAFVAEPDLNQTSADLRKALEHYLENANADDTMSDVRFAAGFILEREGEGDD